MNSAIKEKKWKCAFKLPFFFSMANEHIGSLNSGVKRNSSRLMIKHDQATEAEQNKVRSFSLHKQTSQKAKLSKSF